MRVRYEMHYNTLHRYVCSSCRRCFPTQHLLDLHLDEWHDAMFELKSTSQKMVCFIFAKWICDMKVLDFVS